MPYEDARRAAREKGADFHTIAGGNLGFLTPGDDPGPTTEREQDTVTVDWLVEQVES